MGVDTADLINNSFYQREVCVLHRKPFSYKFPVARPENLLPWQVQEHNDRIASDEAKAEARAQAKASKAAEAATAT